MRNYQFNSLVMIISFIVCISVSSCSEETEIANKQEISLVTESGYTYANSIDEIVTKVFTARPELNGSKIEIMDLLFHEMEDRLVTEIKYKTESGDISNVIYDHKWDKNIDGKTKRTFSGGCVTVICSGLPCCQVGMVEGPGGTPIFFCSCAECTMTYKEVPCE